MPPEEKYNLLPDEDHDEEALRAAFPDRPSRRPLYLRTWVVLAQTVVMTVALVGWAWSVQASRHISHGSQVVYSPAQDVIEYQAKVFDGRLFEPNVYKDKPSDELDKAWVDLYNDFGISQISQSEARFLPNATVPIPAKPDHYIIQFSMFHQLHCLNMIRKALHPEYYADRYAEELGPDQVKVMDHLDHCVDIIRQGIQCASDVSPLVWQWSEALNQSYIEMNIAHSCRNYDKIADWAKAHRLDVDFDESIHVMA